MGKRRVFGRLHDRSICVIETAFARRLPGIRPTSGSAMAEAVSDTGPVPTAVIAETR